jgi:hypothetical protein
MTKATNIRRARLDDSGFCFMAAFLGLILQGVDLSSRRWIIKPQIDEEIETSKIGDPA